MMEFECIEKNGVKIACVSNDDKVITDTQSALDLLASANYIADSTHIAICKDNITEEFFVLSTGIAGEVLQKFMNYSVKVAIYGDYSRYTSKPLKDFIYESNKGRHVFFTSSKEEAIERLANAK